MEPSVELVQQLHRGIPVEFWPDSTDIRARLEAVPVEVRACTACGTETIWYQPSDGRWFCARCGKREEGQEATVAPPTRLLLSTIHLVVAGVVLSALLFGGMAIYVAVR
jgi:ribosomal protein S27AE